MPVNVQTQTISETTMMRQNTMITSATQTIPVKPLKKFTPGSALDNSRESGLIRSKSEDFDTCTSNNDFCKTPKQEISNDHEISRSNAVLADQSCSIVTLINSTDEPFSEHQPFNKCSTESVKAHLPSTNDVAIQVYMSDLATGHLPVQTCTKTTQVRESAHLVRRSQYEGRGSVLVLSPDDSALVIRLESGIVHQKPHE